VDHPSAWVWVMDGEPVRPNSAISIIRQCELLGLARSSFYYQPQPETAQNQRLMKMIDRQFTETPFYGVRRMTAWLKSQAEQVNQKRVRRLMRQMGLEAIYPKPNLSQPQAGANKYPYLLREKVITAPNQVWSTDITYIPLPHGYMYLVAVIDWYSRYVLSWELPLYDGCPVLLECIRKVSGAKYTRDLQFRPRQSVY
jgi:putative transposase